MAKIAAGILAYRKTKGLLEILLAHPGGPLWGKKNLGNWSIPKGEAKGVENLLETAKREFEEETGFPPEGTFSSLGWIAQKSGKIVHCWAMENDLNADNFRSNTFKLEWPPRSGKIQEFPEIDGLEFFNTQTARAKIHPAQIPFIDRLEEILSL